MMAITLKQLVFIGMAAIVLGSAVLVVTLKNIFHSLLFLALSFFGVAGVYFLLSADFLAAVQLLIYIGAVIVLMMFALMLTHRVMSSNLVQRASQWWLGLVVSGGVLGILIRFLVTYPFPGRLQQTSTASTVDPIGRQLMTNYLLPFELASIVLLVAMIGAIILAKEDKPDDPA